MLKKKTQELEKFKFVLDYKIKDLKKDIAPREQEINELKDSTENMDASLKECNDINSSLGFTVDDLRNRQEEMTEMIRASRTKIRKNDIIINDFKNKVYLVVQYIDDHDQLKRAVHNQLFPLVQGSKIKNVEIDPDIKKEYVNQKKYLESSHHSLQKRLEKEDQIHKQDNLNVMGENQKLIEEINNLRNQVNQKKQTIMDQKNKEMRTDAKREPTGTDDQGESYKNGANDGDAYELETLESLRREADMK